MVIGCLWGKYICRGRVFLMHTGSTGKEKWELGKTDLLRDALLGLKSRLCRVNIYLMQDEDRSNKKVVRALKTSWNR